MNRQDKAALQELLMHQGWALYKGLVSGEVLGRKSLKSQVQANLEAAGRSGDGIQCAKFAGQLDILNVVLTLPETVLKGA